MSEGLILPQAEVLIAATGAEFRVGGDRAFYSPAHDYVQVPRPDAYFEPINWHRTALHELGHNAARWIMPQGLIDGRQRLTGHAAGSA